MIALSCALCAVQPGRGLYQEDSLLINLQMRSFILSVFGSAGLTRNFTAGLIYCSPVTAVLLKKDMGMPPEHIMPLPLDQPISIDGVTVTPIDANHCPGAVMFLFHVPARQGTPAQVGTAPDLQAHIVMLLLLCGMHCLHVLHVL